MTLDPTRVAQRRQDLQDEKRRAVAIQDYLDDALSDAGRVVADAVYQISRFEHALDEHQAGGSA